MVTNLGVKIDSTFKLDKQINSVVKSSFYHLRLLSRIKPVLSFLDFERVIHAFVSTRLDYCNALYAGLNKTSLARLQLVQNAVARLLRAGVGNLFPLKGHFNFYNILRGPYKLLTSA